MLVEYFVDKFSGLIDSVDYVSTFKKLMLRREQELDRIENGESEQQSQAYVSLLIISLLLIC